MTQTLKVEGNSCWSSSTDNCTHSALNYTLDVLVESAHGLLTWEERLRQLAAAFQAEGAGLAGLVDGASVVHYHVGPTLSGNLDRRWPWDDMPDLLIRAQSATTALPIRGPDGRQFLLSLPAAQNGARSLFWLEDHAKREWTEGDAAALTMATMALNRFVNWETGTSTWARWLGRARLEQRLEDMSVVITRLSHDFGNVLTGILGFTELGLAQLEPTGLAFKRIQEVYEAAQTGVQYLNRLNRFSQRSGRQRRSTFLAAVVAEETSRLRLAWGEAITIQVSVPADLPPVSLDVPSLRLILVALLENARQAISQTGKVTVTASRVETSINDCLELLGEPKPGPCLHLLIEDTGTGFSLEAQRRVFAEPFFSTKPRHRGMGLVSVYGLLRAYGGGLRLEHPEKGGARVHVYLPLAQEVVNPEPATEETPEPVGRPRVLIVEDDPLTRRLTRVALQGTNWEVETACDGVEALELCTKGGKPFDLFLVDVVMPRMDGFELARHLVARDSDVKILFTSGHVPAGFDQESFGGRSFPLLSKPFTPDVLIPALRKALGGR